MSFCFSVVIPGIASAREFTSPGSMEGGEYKYVKNADGTFTEYYSPSTGAEIVRGDTYSAEGISESDVLAAESAVDSGTTGQDGSIVSGSNEFTRFGSKGVEEALKTGEPYKSLGEAEIGDDVIGEAVVDGTLPSLEATASATLAGTVVVGGGAILAGVALGAGVDQLLGVVEFGEVLGSSEVGPPKVGSGCAFGGQEKCQWKGEWLGEVRIGTVADCEAQGFVSPFSWFVLPGTSGAEGVCVFPEVSYRVKSELTEEHVKKDYECESFGGDGGSFWSSFETGTCTSLVPDSCPTGPWQCESAFSGPGGKLYRTSEQEAGFNHYYSRLWTPLEQFVGYGSFPSDEELFGYEKRVSTRAPGEVSPLAPIPTPLAPPEPTELPAPVRHKIIEKAKQKPSEKEKEEEEECGEEERCKKIPGPLIKPVEKGSEIPNPSNPVVPQPHPGGELYPEYAKDVEHAGFPDVSKKVLPDSAIDPSVGPDDVSRVDPSPGTSADPATEIKVDVNPSDAPIPAEGGHGGIGGPTEPGIKLPHIILLCTVFPFGVPCWLKEQLEAFSSSSSAPVWSIGPIKWGGTTIPKAEIDLAKIEPIMEVVRPFMIIFGGIGIVFFFYKVFTGNSIGGGENPSGQVPEPAGESSEMEVN